MSYSGFLAVGIGGVLGCWLRWVLAVLLNPLFPTVPLGTLAANLIGGLLMGCVLGIFDHFQTLPLEKYGLEWIQPPAPVAHPLDDGPPVMLHRSRPGSSCPMVCAASVLLRRSIPKL